MIILFGNIDASSSLLADVLDGLPLAANNIRSYRCRNGNFYGLLMRLLDVNKCVEGSEEFIPLSRSGMQPLSKPGVQRRLVRFLQIRVDHSALHEPLHELWSPC